MVKINDRNNNKSGLTTALVGAALGAAFVTLAHEPTRKRVKKALMDALEEGDRKLDQLGKKAEEAKDKAGDKISELAEKVDSKVSREVRKARRLNA